MTIEIFRANEELRKRLIAAEDILNLAFDAADKSEDARAALSSTTDLARDAQEHAGRIAILRYKRTIEALKEPLISSDAPVAPTYQGSDPYADLALEQKPL